ncbi:hypothetical protein P7C70_g4016, partial [Phenoliferia sp. Uapishka_3]
MSSEKPSYAGSGTSDDPFIVTFAEQDVDNPKNWPTLRKWSFMLIYAVGMMSGTFAVSSYTSGFAGMIQEFGTTSEVLVVGQFLFLVGPWRPAGPKTNGSGVRVALSAGTRENCALTPFAPYRTLTAFAAFSVGTAAAKNMATVLVSRALSGFFSAGIQTLGPASLSSLFSPQQIAVPFTVAAISPFLGPSVGPLVGGYVTEYTGSWRNINWVAVGFAGVMALLSIIVPELHGPAILRARAQRLSTLAGAHYISAHDVGRVIDLKSEARVHLLKPFIYLLKEYIHLENLFPHFWPLSNNSSDRPIALLFSFYIAFLYAILQVFFTAFPIIYQKERKWPQGNAGLPFVALIPVTMICSKPYLKRLRRDGKAAPEHRLYFAMIAAVLLPIALFWMGWTARPSVHWLNPVIAGGIFGFAQIGITMSVFVYFADLYTHNVGAVFAGMNFLR